MFPSKGENKKCLKPPRTCESKCTVVFFWLGQSAPILFKFKGLLLPMCFFQAAITPDSAGPGEASCVASIVFLHSAVVRMLISCDFPCSSSGLSNGSWDRLFHLVRTQLGMSKFSFFGCFPLTFGLGAANESRVWVRIRLTRPCNPHLWSRCFRSPLSDYLLSLQTHWFRSKIAVEVHTNPNRLNTQGCYINSLNAFWAKHPWSVLHLQVCFQPCSASLAGGYLSFTTEIAGFAAQDI